MCSKPQQAAAIVCERLITQPNFDRVMDARDVGEKERPIEIVRILLACAECGLDTAYSKRLLPTLLYAYSGTMSTFDVTIRRLLHLYESRGMMLSAFSYEFGSSVQREFLNMQSSLKLDQTSDLCDFVDVRFSWYLSSLSDQHATGARDASEGRGNDSAGSGRRGIIPRRFWDTIKSFPHERKADPESPPFASFSRNDEPREDSGSAIYDPSYFLPCLLHVLSVHRLLVADVVPPSSIVDTDVADENDVKVATSGAISRVSRLVTLLSHSGAIALTLVCCSSSDERRSPDCVHMSR